MRSRGVALLLCLVVVAIAPLVALTAVRAPSRAIVEEQTSLERRLAEAIVRDLSAVVLAWAQSAATPGVSLRDWTPIYMLDLGEASCTVRAIDLSGRAKLGSTIEWAAAALPPELRTAVGRSDGRGAGRENMGELIPSGPDVRLMPGPGSAVVATEWLTTHGSGALNLQSAPLPLLEAALAGADQELARIAIKTRKAGEAIPPALIHRLSVGVRGDRSVALSGIGSAFGFDIAIEHSTTVDRWWLVAEQSPGGGWRIAERRRIPPA